MEEFYSRTAMLLGQTGIEKLKKSHVAVFGVGGVGGAACEALARAGVGTLSVFDNDVVCRSNLNRQAVAFVSTLGMAKVEAMAQKISDINPACKVLQNQVFFLPENADNFDFSQFDYIIDAVDTVSAKLEIISRAKQNNVRVISAMGAGNKLHPELFKIADIHKTSVCPLARVMRRELKKRGIHDVKTVYSTEEAFKPLFVPQEDAAQKQNPPGSISFVPAAMGLILAGEVVRSLLELK